MKELNISVGVFVPKQPHELLKEVVCQYFGISEHELMLNTRKPEFVYRRSLMYSILFKEMDYTLHRVADIYGISRQGVTSLIENINYAKSRYLHFSCDYNAIKDLFSTLQIKQQEWMQQNIR